MSDTPPVVPPKSVTRPTLLAQLTIVGLLVSIILQTVGLTWVLTFAVHWPERVWEKVAGYLGIALWIMCVAQIIGIAAFLSPMIGTIKISGPGGIDVNIDGSDK